VRPRPWPTSGFSRQLSFAADHLEFPTADRSTNRLPGERLYPRLSKASLLPCWSPPSPREHRTDVAVKVTTAKTSRFEVLEDLFIHCVPVGAAIHESHSHDAIFPAHTRYVATTVTWFELHRSPTLLVAAGAPNE